jgi:hypothetical protein
MPIRTRCSPTSTSRGGSERRGESVDHVDHDRVRGLTVIGVRGGLAAREPRVAILRGWLWCSACWLAWCSVTPTMCTDRGPSSMTNKQDRRFRVTAPSAGKTSQASIVDAGVPRSCCRVESLCRCGVGGTRGAFKGPADRRGTDPVAEPWAVHLGSSATPRSGSPWRGVHSAWWVSALTGGRRVWGGYIHFLVIRRRCLRRMVPGVSRRYWRTVGGRGRMSAASTARSAQGSSRGVGLAGRTRAPSWRRTSNSPFVDAEDRPSNHSQPSTRTKIR